MVDFGAGGSGWCAEEGEDDEEGDGGYAHDFALA